MCAGLAQRRQLAERSNGVRVWQIGAGLARVGGSGVVRGAHDTRGGAALCAVLGEPLGWDAAGGVAVDEGAWQTARRAAGVIAVWAGGVSPGGSGLPAWGPAGAARLEAVLAWAAARSQRDGVRVWLRTHAGHVLSDAVGARRVGAWAAQRAPGVGVGAEVGVGVMWDLPAMLTPGMLARAQDHLTRMVQDAADSRGVGAVLLAGARADADGRAAWPVPLTSMPGVFDAQGVIGLARRALADVPVLVLPQDAALAQ
ncbi:MAG: hypothetical protein C0475_03360 [Planctomyces sp.]|nr:hypothetical protein [Planctomyces sp.]